MTERRFRDLLMQLSVGPALAVSFGLAACTTVPAPKDNIMQTMCGAADLARYSQRALLAGGYRALEQHDLACAEKLTTKARQLNPQDPWAALNLGAIYQRTQRLKQARSEYAATIALDTNTSTPQAVAESSAEATRESARGQRPADIARSNLALMGKQ